MAISPRAPVVTATPSTVMSGSFVHLTVGGFNNNTSRAGLDHRSAEFSRDAYGWVLCVGRVCSRECVQRNDRGPRRAGFRHSCGANFLHDSRGSSVALTPRDPERGWTDRRAGSGGCSPLTVVLKDSLGNPAPGQPVTFAASPGAQLVSASAHPPMRSDRRAPCSVAVVGGTGFGDRAGRA